MSSDFNFTSEIGLHEYLVATGSGPAKVDLLTGGTANYVYRVTLSDGQKLIFKHAQPYLSSNKNFAFDPARIAFEAGVLQGIAQLELNTASNTHAVRFHSYKDESKFLCIADGGDRNLKDAYTDASLNMREIGVDLAAWLASLHTASRSTRIDIPTLNVSIASGGGNNAIAVKIYRHSYNNLHTALAKFGHDVALAEKVNSEFGSQLATDDECLCHGDFWPGNVLVQPKDSDAKAVPELTVVDWEMSRRGTSATDVGQFAAEAFLLDRFRGNSGLRVNFLDRYVAAREAAGWPVGREWVRRMAVHWATHVAYWPTRVPWTDEKGTEELVAIGVRTLKSVLEGDWEGLKESELFGDLVERWETVFGRD
ncbi:kinase-like domain-containing protein [Phaeosphaeria sp. MPI-PUGE-AT-0046c]|nr:kinase-like domain-containing protein [Phaeosphaeria sp. MPI-PUGE-AT-0046c]